MQFRLRTLLLVFVVVASALGAFGAWGLVIAPYLIAVLLSVRLALVRLSGAAAVAILLAFMGLGLCLMPVRSHAGPAARRAACCNKLKQLGIALHNYHDARGCYPVAFGTDARGRPVPSWRVSILPFVEEVSLYQQYRFDEPWNGPNNRSLMQFSLSAYRCDAQPDPIDGERVTTPYVAVTGPGTAWPGPPGCSLKEIKDPANTILLVEIADSDIHWMEPRDLPIEKVLADEEGLAGAITSHHGDSDGYFLSRTQRAGGNVLMADGSVHYLDGRPSPEDLAALLRIDGNKPVAIENLKLRSDPPVIERIRWDHVIALPLFLVSLLVLVSRPLPKRPEPPGQPPLAGQKG